MIGPPSLEEAMRDFSALGGYAVLITATVCFSVFARAELGREMLRFFVMTVTSGFAAGVLFKQLIRRDRPALVPHLSHVSGNTSFPSSHAMMSVVVFITIGLLLSQLSPSRALRHVLVGLPFLIAFLVGVSRVCMGVHFPTDVLGGWAIGLLWVWGAFAIRGRFLAR
jgi:undecaprenyl-diphosphatase